MPCSLRRYEPDQVYGSADGPHSQRSSALPGGRADHSDGTEVLSSGFLDVDVRPDGNGWAAYRRAAAAALLYGWVRAIRAPSGGLHLHYPGTDQRNGSTSSRRHAVGDGTNWLEALGGARPHRARVTARFDAGTAARPRCGRS